MRLLLVGAFPYPHDQGSQIYFQEQAIALRSAGAEVHLLTYASGRTQKSPTPGSPERALAGFEHRTPPRWTSPRSLRSGPSWGKPLGDLGLAMTLRHEVASKFASERYDAVLTHNAEAAVAALIALGGHSRRRPAIVYCAHTLLGHELSSYSRSLKNMVFSERNESFEASSGRAAQILDRIGHRIDRWIAERVDGWISLTQTSERGIRRASNTPGALIPPPIPDPRTRPFALESDRIARTHRLEPGRFFLYSGNRDGYQELEILRAVAERRKRLDGSMRLVIASHRDRAATSDTRRPDASRTGIESLRIDSADEMLGLIAAARASLVLRRTAGGFPIKLANSLAVGTPPIAFLDTEWGLSDGRDSLICRPEEPVTSLAAAIERLSEDDDEVTRLSTGARALYEDRHRPEHVAARTGELLEEIVAQHHRR